MRDVLALIAEEGEYSTSGAELRLQLGGETCHLSLPVAEKGYPGVVR